MISIDGWKKAYYESKNHRATVVCLIPARTDTRYWSEFCMSANEIRLVKGRLRFGDSNNSAPFPSVVIIFRPSYNNLRVTTMSSYITPYNPIINSKYCSEFLENSDELIEGIWFE